MQKILLCLFIACFMVSAAEYDRILQDMNAIVSENSNYAQLIDIGKNDQGNTIYGLRLENPQQQADNPDGKVVYLVVGTHHGNERKCADASIIFARRVITSLKNSGDKFHARMSRAIMYVIPVLNIGGFNANNRYERDRYNRSCDPNRDYPDACAQNAYFQLASIQNLVNFVERQNIVASVTIHGYIGTFTYPWGIYTSQPKTLDDAMYQKLGSEAIKANSYRTGTHTEVIYPASGAYEDWAYHKHGMWTMLLELNYTPDLTKDSEALMIYFSLVPDTRSGNHQHTGTCTATTREEMMAERP